MSVLGSPGGRERKRTGGSTRNKLSAGVLIIVRRYNYPRGRAWQDFLKIFSKKSHSSENCRTVTKIPYSTSLHIETNYRMLLPILKH